MMLLFSFQVLPVKKMGKLLCKAQATEQVQYDDDCGVDNDDDASLDIGFCAGDFILSYQSFLQDNSGSIYLEQKAALSFQRTLILPDALVARIPSPPPEC